MGRDLKDSNLISYDFSPSTNWRKLFSELVEHCILLFYLVLNAKDESYVLCFPHNVLIYSPWPHTMLERNFTTITCWHSSAASAEFFSFGQFKCYYVWETKAKGNLTRHDKKNSFVESARSGFSYFLRWPPEKSENENDQHNKVVTLLRELIMSLNHSIVTFKFFILAHDTFRCTNCF